MLTMYYEGDNDLWAMLMANEISLVVACSSLSAICVCKGQRYANGYTVSYGTVYSLYHDHLLVFLLEYLYSNTPFR